MPAASSASPKPVARACRPRSECANTAAARAMIPAPMSTAARFSVKFHPAAAHHNCRLKTRPSPAMRLSGASVPQRSSWLRAVCAFSRETPAKASTEAAVATSAAGSGRNPAERAMAQEYSAAASSAHGVAARWRREESWWGSALNPALASRATPTAGQAKPAKAPVSSGLSSTRPWNPPPNSSAQASSSAAAKPKAPARILSLVSTAGFGRRSGAA